MKFLLPQYWLSWLLVGSLFVLSVIPLRVSKVLSWLIGSCVYSIDARHRRISRINIALCFPELDETTRKQIAMNSFRSMFFGICVLAGVWFASRSRNLARIRIHDDDRIQQAIDNNKSVILVASHQACLESTVLLGTKYPMVSMYRKNPNALLDYITRRGRQRFNTKVIARNQARKMVSESRKAQICCIVPDQDIGSKGSVFATFFGMPAATTTLIPRMQQINSQSEIFISSATWENGLVHIRISGPITFATDENMESKVTTINELTAAQIRRFPDQYLWQHRRFKTQPDGVQSPYE